MFFRYHITRWTKFRNSVKLNVANYEHIQALRNILHNLLL
jgi:hypothetical protein